MLTEQNGNDNLCTRCREKPGFIIPPPELTSEGGLWCKACLLELQPHAAGGIAAMLEGMVPMEDADGVHDDG